MNDDFLKKHRVRPNPHFVESLYQTLETKNKRTFSMFSTNKMRPAFFALAIFLGVGLLTLAVSPTARAAIEALFTFNGVEVTVDDNTGNIVATGNTDAIIDQTDHSILIQSADPNEMMGMSVDALEIAPVDSSELATLAPDFVLPTHLPAGYTLDDEAFVSDGVVSVSWTNSAGDTIHYNWGNPPLPDDLALPEGAIVVTDSSADFPSIDPYTVIPNFTGDGEMAVLAGEQDGVAYSILATDTSLGEAVLQAIVP
ncbi:MAG TPA: hypothetical protein ENJ56_04760 [Anaerolineae bacterium]|nr:hypothetical protein [Anaerolineae bacterium]